MGVQLWANNPSTFIGALVSPSATSITLNVGGGAQFPSPTNGDWFIATIISQSNAAIREIVKITARSGDSVTVVRAQEGTTALTWQPDDIFEMRITAGGLSGLGGFNTLFLGGVATIAALRALTNTAQAAALTNGAAINVNGYNSAADGGGGQFQWNSTSTAADNGGTIIAPTGVATGRWFRTFSLSDLNARWFGAYGDGSHDDTTALTNLMAASLAAGLGCYFPEGTYLTGTLRYSFQNLRGDGPDVTVIQGKPALDVFYAPDPSISEAGSIASAPVPFRVENLSVFTDSSGSPAFSRPIYPLKGAWGVGVTVHAGQYYTSSGNVYVCTGAGPDVGTNPPTSGVTANPAPTHTVGVAADGGGVNWLYVDSAVPNIENAAFAFPFSNGAGPGNTVLNIFANFYNVTMKDNAAGSNLTACIYAQRPAYGSRFINTRFYPAPAGFLNVPPTSNFESVTYSPDTCSFLNCDFSGVSGGNSYPWVSFNGDERFIAMCSMYTAHTGDRCLYLLGYYDARGSGGSVRNANIEQLYCEGGTAGDQFMLIMGSGHSIQNLNTTCPTGAFAVLAADGCFVNAWNTSGGNNIVQVWGDHNEIKGLLQTSPATTVNDQGKANQVETNASTGVVFQARRPYSNANHHRPGAINQQTTFFADKGLFATPCANGDDLFFAGDEVNWGATPTSLTVDTASPSGCFVTLPTGGNFFTGAWPNQALAWANQLPACPGKFYVRTRASSGMSGNINILSGATSIGSTSVTWTTGFQTFECDYDATGFNGALTLELNFGGGGPTIDVSYMYFRPYAFDTLTNILQLKATTFANLPANPDVGMIAAILDSPVATWNATVSVGGSTNNVAIWWNGTNWKVFASN